MPQTSTTTAFSWQPYFILNSAFQYTENAQAAFLAPRGICMYKNCLVVSDTGQNRVFIWKQFPSSKNADIVLGQVHHFNTARNAGGEVNASSLLYPSGVWTNGECLIVADAWNHRVLIWNTLPTAMAQPADIVIGQPDFFTNLPNVEGVGKPPTASSLCWPYGVYSNGKHLWIADTGNRRILFYENIPQTNFAKATHVIGQSDFTQKDYDAANAVWPYSVKISEQGSMLVADTQQFRVLVWHCWQNAFSKKADVIIGQPDFESNGQNQFRLLPNAHTLSWCYDGCFMNNKLLVADTGNSRILIWNELPSVSNAAATGIIGQPHFEINGEQSLNKNINVTNALYWPFSISSYNNLLAVADTGNHRILFYKL